MKSSYRFFAFGFSCLRFVYAQESLLLDSPQELLFGDLEKVQKIDESLCRPMPLKFNYLLQGGYFMMPSARTFSSGNLGFSGAYAPPFHIWSLQFQLFDRLELSGNYWTATNGPIFPFSENSDRTLNAKVVLFKGKDFGEYLPDLAVGINDLIDRERFYSFYTVLTKEMPSWNLETSLGLGHGQIQGIYGGVAWYPLRHSKYFWKSLALAGEYDATRYEFAKVKARNRVNLGAQISFFDLLTASFSSIRGKEIAFSGSVNYNFGKTKGLFPKTLDPGPYKTPIDTEDLGDLRSERELAQELAYTFKEQGFDLYNLYLIPDTNGQDALSMKIINVRYWDEEEVRRRIQSVLAALTPSNIVKVTVSIEVDGVLSHSYTFSSSELSKYRENLLGEPEMKLLFPKKERVDIDPYSSTLLYERKKPIWTLIFRPWFRPFFGTSEGKFKFEVGALMGLEGYILDQVYYRLKGNYTAYSSKQSLIQEEDDNPSKLINVRTDSLQYNQSSSFHVEEAYLQKSFNWGNGFLSRLSTGYFEIAYAGIATESLYYPVNSNWAIGIQGACLLKRDYYGIGFQKKIRKVSPQGEKFFPYIGLQYFFDAYYQIKPWNLDFKASVGQFLARDKGIRIEGGRTFQSGLRIGLWYTMTNGNDVVNESRYFDKGFSVSMPLDFFLNKSSRSRVGFAMSARLRDVGAISATGKPLYQTLFWERYNR